ncbi:MAG: response regulator transcription factor [Leptospirales bacterium]|nr:response regulator transcription factor [Leptospirales bacterium]
MTQVVTQEKKKVLIVEDHPLMVEGLTIAINRTPDLGVCGSAETIAEALKKIESAAPDVLILDLNLKSEENGLQSISKLRELHPALPILVHSMHTEHTYIERSLNAGARGYVNKREGNEALLAAIRKALKNETYLNPENASRIVDRLFQGQPETRREPVQNLSNRELEIFEMIGRGSSTREIAQALALSVSTIETHRANIKSKLKLQSNSQLVKAAVEWVLRSSGSA